MINFFDDYETLNTRKDETPTKQENAPETEKDNAPETEQDNTPETEQDNANNFSELINVLIEEVKTLKASINKNTDKEET